MRLVLLAMLVACSSKNPQREDLQLFCSSEAAAHAKSFADLGPFLEPKLHGSEFAKSFLAVKAGSVTVDEFRKQALLQLADEQIADCPTMAAISGPK